MPALPFSNSTKGKTVFLNTSPIHKDGSKMLSYYVAHIGTQEVYINTNKSAMDIAAGISALLTAMEAPPDVVKVVIK